MLVQAQRIALSTVVALRVRFPLANVLQRVATAMYLITSVRGHYLLKTITMRIIGRKEVYSIGRIQM